MNSVGTSHARVVRVLRLAAALAVAAAVIVWLTPVNAMGRNLVPVGCGTPASPLTDSLTQYVCRDLVDGAKVLAVALVACAAVFLLLSEIVVPRIAGRTWLIGPVLASVVAAPILVVAVSTLLTTVASSGADGTLIRCGTPVDPAADAISKRMCGQLPDRDRSLAIGGIVLSVLTLVGSAYVAREDRVADVDSGAEDVSDRFSPHPADRPDAERGGADGMDTTSADDSFRKGRA